MALKERFIIRICDKCQESKSQDRYVKTHNPLYLDGYCPICKDCLEKMIKDEGYSWDIVDKFCQYLGIPFVPKQWENIHKNNKVNPFSVYTELFDDQRYQSLDWGMYYKEFKALEGTEMIKEELPLFDDDKIRKLKEEWGPNYDADELRYLENLYKGVLNTQSINGDLQNDQAKKLCKISLEIESRIRAGQDFDKLLKSYESLVKIAEFTPKNAKNASDFDSLGELVRWLEKRGWKNQYFDGVSRDIVDESIHNIQAYNQRLYTNETGIADEIANRIEALKQVAEMEKTESDFDTDKVCDDFDAYDNVGYEGLMKEEFSEDVGEIV